MFVFRSWGSTYSEIQNHDLFGKPFLKMCIPRANVFKMVRLTAWIPYRWRTPLMLWFSHLSREDMLLVMLNFPEDALLMDPEGIDYWMEYRVLKDHFGTLWDDFFEFDAQELIDRYLHLRGMMNTIQTVIGIANSVWLKNEHCF
jgi:hypothetical protein